MAFGNPYMPNNYYQNSMNPSYPQQSLMAPYNGYLQFQQPIQQNNIPIQPNSQSFSQNVQNENRPLIKGWGVSSEEEAKHASIDLDGSIYIFPDLQNRKIYTKQINTSDYSPIFNVYELIAQSVPNQTTIDLSGYVPKSDFKQLNLAYSQLSNIVNELTQRVNNLSNMQSENQTIPNVDSNSSAKNKRS